MEVRAVVVSSLHTKYRPNTFEGVLGQDQVIETLPKIIEAKRAHSFIFSGPSGTGKTTLARIVASELVGELSPLNLIEFPASEKSGKDDVKGIINSTYYRAMGASPIKVVIVDEAHRLSAAAWDALLKPVEEPQEHVFWVFCTTEPGKIPKAIVTRCVRYDLKPVNEEQIANLLCDVAEAEELEISDEILLAIAENCGGSPRQALVYLEACQYCETANDAQQIMRSAGQSKEVVDLCRFLTGGRGVTWAEALKHIKPLEGNIDAESARLVVVSYLTKVLMNTKDEQRAKGLLMTLDCFAKPYLASEKFAPLLMSVGMALGLDR
jgi:DNA polymerase III subunit gamma/tau